jgi:hypothetical protein
MALALALCASASLIAVEKGKKSAVAGAAARMAEEQRALHALNRLTFGPRPGDVERVRALGVDK